MEAKRALVSRWLGSKLLDQCIEVIIHTEITARECIGIAAGESQHQLHGAVDRRIASFGVQGLVPMLHPWSTLCDLRRIMEIVIHRRADDARMDGKDLNAMLSGF